MIQNEGHTLDRSRNTDAADLRMNVNAGSKLSNLIPFAVNSFKRPCCRKVIWKSTAGGVAKTVACAERFKQIVLSSSKQTPDSPPFFNVLKDEPITQLYQLTKISTVKRNCVDRDTMVTYVLVRRFLILQCLSNIPNSNRWALPPVRSVVYHEESAIIISLSKDPIPEETFVQLVTSENPSVSSNIPSSLTSFQNPKPLSRRQLVHSKKRKREPTKDPLSKQLDPFRSRPNSALSDKQPVKSIDFPPVMHQSPRLAPALLAVSGAVKKSKKKKI
ncbi:hypothetical protein X801_03539 [Opisthorchis viverrini]|uniref:DNA/RNA-binding protein Alba-like domain-containing protein n=1 Tax=Opisthorchis viverrini TaxID=6198 RepID=A0A1S8X1I5_OPIVI|nr:hypothetical protein X801_03539 [Opisthorchis viverrini]